MSASLSVWKASYEWRFLSGSKLLDASNHHREELIVTTSNSIEDVKAKIEATLSDGAYLYHLKEATWLGEAEVTQNDMDELESKL